MELSELQPLDAERRFVDKMEALERLGGGIAHEFNNLLTAILATTDLAIATPGIDSALQADLQSIRAAGQRAAAVTRQLLAFSGNQSVSLRTTDINELLALLEPLLRHIVAPPITLRLETRGTGAVEVDPARLEQVVLNLVVNAVEAMPRGGTLTVATEDVGPFATILVEDTGEGMDEVTLARLFEPFHTTKAVGGRGLGLASVYGTVRQMHGSTNIESTEGKGTRVRLLFQRVVAPVELEFVSVPSPAPRVGGEVVLVVEDEPSVRAPVCRTLRSHGYFVLEADNGEHALRVMNEYHSPIHLVITDVRMPEMDGRQLVTLLRSWYPSMRVLFISGYSPELLRASEDSSFAGAHFLPKPFSLEQLLGSVREILDAEWIQAMEDR